MKLIMPIIFFFVLVSSGCIKEVIIERNITVEKPTEIIKEIEIIKIVNQSCPECICEEYPGYEEGDYSKDYVLRLIRQIKRCEQREIKNINLTECVWDFNKSQKELQECKKGFCRFNSSWC